MPRFYYHIRQDGTLQEDAEGIELESIERARREAVLTLSELALEEFPRDGDHQNLSVEVFDEGGACVVSAVITFTLQQSDGSRRNPAAGGDADR